MARHKYIKLLAVLLVFSMLLSAPAPMTVFAEEEQKQEEATNLGDDSVHMESNEEEDMLPEDTQSEDENQIVSKEKTTASATEQEGEPSEEPTTGQKEALEESVIQPAKTYGEFLASLKVLEGYAADYAAANGGDVNGLVINYIRTGIEKYNDGSWAMLAGPENTEFTAYVKQQDETNGTAAQAVRGIDLLTTPDGNSVEFGHMFGTIDIAYSNNNATEKADFGGWAGDLVDLLEYVKGKVTIGDMEVMVSEIRENYFGIDSEDAHSFGNLDLYGDLDAFYLLSKISSGQKLSTLMENYFSADLKEVDRVTYFLNNRFPGKNSKESIRAAVLDAYQSNNAVTLLEADRNLTGDSELRKASCYAFADYLYEISKDTLSGNPYYTIFSSNSSTLAPGITQDIKYANTADDKQIVYYIATVDVKRDDVSIYANYKDNDGSVWGMSRVTDQMAAAQAKHTDPDDSEHYIENYNTIVGVNADFYNMTNGAPSGALVMEGVEYHGVGSENFFGILKDGTPIIGGSAEWNANKDQIQEAVGASMYLVKDGKISVNTTADYYKSRASRTCVGITADGQVILMALDGRQEPFSVGGSAEEMAQIMLEAGCVTAVNLDGGGSTTFAAKEEGDDKVTVVNRPSDGYERSVSSSILVVSTARPSNEFDHALIAADADYLTVGTSTQLSVSGVSISGGSAEIPEGAKLRISDENIGTLSDGTFTASERGNVTVELVLGDTILGSKELHVVEPDGIRFEKEKVNAVYGVEIPLPVVATYQGNTVAISPSDVSFEINPENAGVIDGFGFTGDEGSGARMVTVTASLTRDLSVHEDIEISLYKNGEAIFDFDNSTEGDRSLAWNRDVSNSTTEDEKYYHVTDPDKDVDISYIFAVDMETIKIPEQIKPLMSLLPGGDKEDRAWPFLLQLAERVSVLTEVKVEMDVDPNLNLDVEDMKLSNEYFTLDSVEFDEDAHTLTITCKWMNQTQAIDPSTANPICIISGLKATPKEDSEWDKDNCLKIQNSGRVSYDIYLRSSTLYNVASTAAIQQQYGIYPFKNPDVIVGGVEESGAHFATTFKEFEDSFTLDKSVRQGWTATDENLYYFVDNKAVTGIQYIPGYQDEENTYYYRFDENGVCQGKITGLFELNDDLYYAINGVSATGWRVVTVSGADNYYFFDPATGKAVDGEQTINGYHYVFTDHILTRGDLVSSADGLHYKWAGEWVMNAWVEIDGNKYYAGKAPYGYFVTSKDTYIYKYGSDSEKSRCLFDENGVWQENYSGLYTDENDNTYLIEKGYLIEGAGLVYLDGDYYYFRTSTSTAVKGRTYWATETNGLLPVREYTFADDGKMIDPPGKVDPDPSEPEPDVKNGIIAENGSLYYYVDGVPSGAGLIQIDGDYYYAKTSNGEIVHGRSYWITVTNDLLSAKEYTFADDGKMIDPPEKSDPDPSEPEPDVKNGIIAENGSLYYYVDGVLSGAGLIQIDGDYYYAKTSNGEIIHDRTYWITVTNELLPSKEYTFDDTGKIVF